MFNSIYSLGCLFLVILLSSNLSISPTTSIEPIRQRIELERGLYDLDKYLEQATKRDSNERQPKVLIHKDWLAKLQANKPELNETIKLFLSLKNLENQDTCNARGYEIIREYNLASKGLAKYGVRIVDRVAFQYMVKHARLCEQKYVDSLNELKLDSRNFQRVKQFAEFITKQNIERTKFNTINPDAGLSYALEFSPIEFIRLMSDIRRSDREDAKNIRQFLLESGDKTAKISNNVDDLESKFNNYIYKPCVYFVNQIANDIYDPFMQDHETLMDYRRASRQKLEENQLKTAPREFYESLAYVKVCRMYALDVDKSKFIESLLSIGNQTS